MLEVILEGTKVAELKGFNVADLRRDLESLAALEEHPDSQLIRDLNQVALQEIQYAYATGYRHG